MTSSCSPFSHLNACREAVLQDLAEVDRAMARAEEDRIHLKRRLNMSTPIAALPVEVLENVFLYCVCGHERRSGRIPFFCLDCAGVSKPCELVVTHVCHNWRTIAIQYSRLWAITSITLRSHRGQCLDTYTTDIQLPRAGLGPLVVEANLNYFDWSLARSFLEACVAQRLHLIGELAITYWDKRIYDGLVPQDAPPLILRRFELGSMAPRRKKRPLPIIGDRPCPLLEVLSIGGVNIHCIDPSRFPSLQELTLHLPPWTTLDAIIVLLEGLPTLRKVRLSQSNAPRPRIHAHLNHRTIELPVLRSLSLVNFLALLINFLVFPPSADLSFCYYYSDFDVEWDRSIYHLMASVLASHFSRIPKPLAAPFRLQRLTIHENIRSYSLPLRHHRGKYVSILGYEDVAQGNLPYQDVRFQIAEIPTMPGVADIVLKLCKSIPLASVRVLHIPAIGQFQRRHWKILVDIMPGLETLSVEGEHAGRDLLNVLTAGMATEHQLPFPTLKRVKFVFKCETDRPWLYPKETDAWMCTFYTAIERRRELGLMLEEVELDFDSCENSLRSHILSGAYSAESFARIKPLVGRLILHFPRSVDLAEHQRSTSDLSRERIEAVSWFVE